MAHIRKTSNGRFEARYRSPDGTERASRFETRRDAQAFLDQVGVDRQVGRWRDPRSGRTLLADWVAIWQPTTVDLRASSRARDDSYLRTHVLPKFGQVRLDAIRPVDVASWVAELTNQGLAPATVQKAYQTLAKVLRAAVDADLIADTPCRRIRLPKVEADEMRFLSPDEIEVLAETMAPRYRALVLFDAYCGLRLSELAGLRRGAVDLRRRRVRVAHNAVEVRGKVEWGAPKTRAGRRTVPMTKTVAAALEQHLAEFVEDDPAALVFAGADGGVLRGGVLAQPVLAAGDPRCLPRRRPHPRPPPHRGVVVDRSEREPEADRDLGGPHERVGGARPLRTSVRGQRGRRARTSRFVRLDGLW